MKKEILIALFLFCLVLPPFVSNLSNERVDVNENYWILSSRQYFRLFVKEKNWHSAEWKERSAYATPPLGKYLIGFVIEVFGSNKAKKEIERLPPWDFSKNDTWNLRHGAFPSMEVLLPVRMAMAIFGVLGCFLIYVIGRMLSGIKTGVFAALLLAYNPAMLSCSKLVIVDAPLLFFMTLSVLFVILFVRKVSENKATQASLFAACAGASGAFAASIKLNGVLSGVIFLGVSMVLLLLRFRRYQSGGHGLCGVLRQTLSDDAVRLTCVGLFISGCWAAFIFLILNPTLYEQPFAGIMGMMQYRIEEVRYQQSHFGPAITTIGEKIAFVFRKTLLPHNFATLSQKAGVPFDLLFFFSGLIVLFLKEAKSAAEKFTLSPAGVVLVWVLVMFAGTVLWIPLDWKRYYLPVIPCVAILTAFTLDKCVALLMNLKTGFARREAKEPPGN